MISTIIVNSKYKLKMDQKMSMSWCFSAAVESSDYICINIVYVVKPGLLCSKFYSLYF